MMNLVGVRFVMEVAGACLSTHQLRYYLLGIH
jgi:hypothetical protein